MYKRCGIEGLTTHIYGNTESNNTVAPTPFTPTPAHLPWYFELNPEVEFTRQNMQNNCHVQMYSIMSGVLVLDQQAANFNGNFDIDVSNVPDGLYSLILLQGSEIIQQ